MTGYADFYRRSIDDREGFWAEEAKAIDWKRHRSKSATTAIRPLPAGLWVAPPTCATTP